MKTFGRLSALLLLTPAILACQARAAEGTSRAELEALVKDIEVNAELWLQDAPENTELDKKLKGVTYDGEAALYLKGVFRTARKSPIDLYVVNKLLEPMLMAKPQVVREILPTVQNIQARTAVREFGQFPAAQLKRKKMAPYKAPATANKILADLVELERGPEEKKKADALVAKHSKQVTLLTTRTAKLMLYAEAIKFDRLALGMLIREEEAGRAAWMTILDDICAEAPRMSIERAKAFYDTLRRFGLSLRPESKTYTDYGKPVIRLDANSHFEKAPADKGFVPGIKILEAVNQIAPKARMPAVNIPSKGAIAADKELKEAKRLLNIAKKESFEQAKKKLAKLIKDYPGTPAAQEAQKLLKRFDRK